MGSIRGATSAAADWIDRMFSDQQHRIETANTETRKRDSAEVRVERKMRIILLQSATRLRCSLRVIFCCHFFGLGRRREDCNASAV